MCNCEDVEVVYPFSLKENEPLGITIRVDKPSQLELVVIEGNPAYLFRGARDLQECEDGSGVSAGLSRRTSFLLAANEMVPGTVKAEASLGEVTLFAAKHTTGYLKVAS